MADTWDREVREKLGPRPPRSEGVLASLEFDKRYRALMAESIIAGRAAAPPVFVLPEEAPKKRRRKASSKPKATKAKVANG